MWRIFKLSILLLGLTLVLFAPACGASSLGLMVHVVPLDSNGGNTVRAHFTAITPSPCPSLSGLCSAGEDCLVHTTSLPFTGTKPSPGWCVCRWQKTVPSKYKATINLGSNTEMYVSMNAGPKVRANSGRLNQPAYVGLPPPLRVRANCPHHFQLSVKDLDGDRVTCRFARPDEEECLNCTQHSFIELNEDKCMLLFTGNAPVGQYFIYLMAEDHIPVPKTSRLQDNKPLSSVPVHLSLTVEESAYSCTDETVATGDTPKEDTTLFVLPYQEVQFNTDFSSQRESVSEVAVVGPPELYRVGFKSISSLSAMTMAWIRSQNKLPRLLPICFAANTKSLQSEPRCVWLYQREMRMLPDGTVLTCEKTAMTLVLPVASLRDIDLDELQLNSPTCPITHNSTHLTATISLTGCGTKTVHSGSELVFTNTLQSVRPYTMVSSEPSLVLPLACRIPGVQAKGSQYKIGIPTERETFGEVMIWLELHLPGEGPLAEFTRIPKFRALRMAPGRVRREAESPSESNSSSRYNSTASNRTSTYDSKAIGSRISKVDLLVLSNCSIARAEMMVGNCMESETEDFAVSYPIMEQGCASSESTLEVVTTRNNSKVYRLDLSTVKTKGSSMFVQCTVNLCITTLPSQKCPSLCTPSFDSRILVDSLFTSSYTIRSGRVSLMVTTPAPTTAAVITAPTTTTAPTATAPTTTAPTATAPTATAPTATAPTTTAPTATAPTATAPADATLITAVVTTTNTSVSHAPEQASSMAAGVIITTIGVFLQNILLY
ncbi:mucin-5AC-like [Anarrhichthys ocellatus]|uniref:mucin-5AC-like n=1 Tax=Anarrhichthys ocellatus TaxID=433405 RepID=UPI0012EE36F4|nr:mucin-5AC-like [Anarrhichthys ocellatus]XP_031704179.1 mucin-5AC-like [Anarrhichthys ocellatus]